MAVPVARVHLKVAHAALPALLPTPPKWKTLPMLQTPCPCVVAAIVLPKPLSNSKPSRADTDGRWDARKTNPAASAAEPSASASSGPRRSSVHGSPSLRKNTTSPPPKPGRADAVERWDAHKKAAAASPASSSGKWTSRSSRASSSAERWDMHKKRRLPQAKLLDDGENSSTGTGSNDIDTEEEEKEEEILWKPRAMYAGPGFVVAAPESSMLPMPTAFLVPVA